MKLEILRNWKILLLILLLIGLIIVIAPNPNPSGVRITAKAKDSPIPLSVGDTIYTINGQPATPELLGKNYTGIVQLASSRGEKIVTVNGSLGLTTGPVPSSNLHFGLDVEGGIRVVLALNATDNATLDQTLATLQNRINLYGLREATIRPAYADNVPFIEIIIAGGTKEEISQLLERKGIFEAAIPLNIKINGTGNLQLDKNYTIAISNDSITIDGIKIQTGKSASIAGINFTLNSLTNETINLSAHVFTSSDILIVYFDPSHSGIQQVGGGWRWHFQVKLSNAAAERFALVTSNLDVVFDPKGGESFLSSPLQLYLDNSLVDELRINADLKGKSITEPSITGGGTDKASAAASMKRLQSILRSGALPTDVQIVQIEEISGKLGPGFVANFIFVLICAICAVSIVIAIRYRRIKIILPVLLISFSEVLIILGASVVIGWTLDLASMAAIIAIVGTGIDAQIIMIDQAIKHEAVELSLRERLGRAFFIIIGSAGTTIATMIPLTVFGLGALRGFALTTALGALIGICITRPAFGEIVKKIV